VCCPLQENSVLVLVLRMLALGLHSWDMIESQVFREPKLDPQIVTKFLPSLVSLMVDDEIRKLNTKLCLDDRESAIAVIEHSGQYLLFYLLNVFLQIQHIHIM